MERGTRIPSSPVASVSLIHCGLLVALVSLVYLNSLSGVFLFDDEASIVHSAAIRSVTSLDWLHLRGRPVTTLSLAINYALGGLDPIGYHAVNVSIHILNCLLAYHVIILAMEASSSRCKWSPLPLSTNQFALVATTLWGVHPLCTQAVTYVIQRSESLAAMGILAAMFCWTKAFSAHSAKESSKWWSMAAVGAVVFACGSKESAAFLPSIVLLYDRVVLATSWRDVRQRWLGHLALHGPLILGLTVYLVSFMRGSHADPTSGYSMELITPWAYFTSQPRVFLRYLQLAFLPIGQVLDYGWLPSMNPRAQWMGLAVWGGILTVAVWLLRRVPLVGFLLVASLLILAPSSTFMPLQDIIFEHRMYLPLLSFCLLCTAIWLWFFSRIHARFIRIPRHLSTCIGLAAMAVLGFLTVLRNRDYSSAERLYATDAKRSPDNPRVWSNLSDHGQFLTVGERIAMAEKALGLYEQRGFFYAGTRYKLTRAIGDLYFLTNDTLAAHRYYSKALRNANDELQAGEVHLSLGMIESQAGNQMDADRHFESAIEKMTTIPSVHQAYAVHLRRTGRDSDAIREEKIAAELSGKPLSH